MVLDDELGLELLGRLDEGALPVLGAVFQRVSVLHLGALARVLQPHDVLAEILMGWKHGTNVTARQFHKVLIAKTVAQCAATLIQ